VVFPLFLQTAAISLLKSLRLTGLWNNPNFPTMSHAAPTMSYVAHFAEISPKPWRLKRLLPAPRRLLGAAGAALLKALPEHAYFFQIIFAAVDTAQLNIVDGAQTSLRDLRNGLTTTSAGIEHKCSELIVHGIRCNAAVVSVKGVATAAALLGLCGWFWRKEHPHCALLNKLIQVHSIFIQLIIIKNPNTKHRTHLALIMVTGSAAYGTSNSLI
jgi:hypothetical protein